MQNKKRWPFCCFAFGLLLSLSVFSAPVVSNIVCAQREGTKLVDITYDLTDAENATLKVTIRISKDSGPLGMCLAKVYWEMASASR